MTLEQSICHYAQTTPDKIAAVCTDSSVTYAALWQQIEERAEK